MPLIAIRPSSWDLSPGEARALQEHLSSQAETRDRLGTPALVAGIDVGFEDRGRITRAAVAVLRCGDLQLVESGLLPERIHDVDECTHCREDLYHSYRRQGPGAGRMLSYVGFRS